MSQNSGIEIHMVLCTETLLHEISMKETRQIDIAKTYALAAKTHIDGVEQVDFATVNKAIIDRWSRAGLRRIKELALTGKCWRETSPNGRRN